MPAIKIDYVKSFSSEDPVHIANNVLKNDSKKWKCKTAGEKTAVIVLQLEKATEITGIDIGNEHSAFIEVLVSRSGAGDDYKGLLVASAFMTPSEAKHSQNVNQVRMFTMGHLLRPQCEEKWDRVKIVCTQPFNRYVQYGLSFIVLHTKEDKPGGSIGRFSLRPASPDNFTAGSLFAKLKETKKDETLSGAAAIRDAASDTSLARYGSPKCKPKLKTTDSTPKQSRTKNQEPEDGEERPQKDRNRTDLFYSEDDDKPNDKIDRIIKKKKEEEEAKKKKEEDEAKKKKEDEAKKKKEDDAKKKKKEDEAKIKKEEDDAKNKQSTERNIWGLPKGKKKDSEVEASPRKDKDREKPKQKVKDATPGKANKRKEDSKLDSPGPSKRKTPEDESKRDLKRKKVDTKRDESRKKKKVADGKPFERLLEGVTIVVSGIQNPDRSNLRSMALSMGAKYKPDWDAGCTHLICAFANTPKFNQVKGKGKIVKRTWLEECHKQRKRLPWRRFALDKNDKGVEESEEEICETVEPDTTINDSPKDMDADFSDHKEEGSDTEERIARILAAKASAKKASPTPNGDIYSMDTDEEMLPERTPVAELEKLAVFFDGKTFYIDQSFDDELYAKAKKYIVAYKGKVVEGPTEGVDVIVTTRENSESFKEINGEASCVRPDWIWKCHNENELVDIDDFSY